LLKKIIDRLVPDVGTSYGCYLGLIQCGFCNKMIDAMVSSSDAVAVAGALATPPEGDPPFEMAARW